MNNKDFETRDLVRIIGEFEVTQRFNFTSTFTFPLFENLKEVIIKNFKAWQISYGNTEYLLSEKPATYVLLITKMSYGKYKARYSEIYPCILVNNMVARYFGKNNYPFLPSVEFADNEDCYTGRVDDNDYINVIVGIKLVKGNNIANGSEEEPEIANFKEIQKTYLMKDGHGNTKIGRSYNPKRRERTLQSELPTITLLAICENNIEEELHERFSNLRIRGEWFNLSDKQIGDIIKEYDFKITL